jgi:hypothetical protein
MAKKIAALFFGSVAGLFGSRRLCCAMTQSLRCEAVLQQTHHPIASTLYCDRLCEACQGCNNWDFLFAFRHNKTALGNRHASFTADGELTSHPSKTRLLQQFQPRAEDPQLLKADGIPWLGASCCIALCHKINTALAVGLIRFAIEVLWLVLRNR